MSKSIDLSIVIPLFNEEEVIPFLIQEINKVGATISKNYEVILVDDGSTDNTFELVKKAADKDPQIKVVKFSRNFGTVTIIVTLCFLQIFIIDDGLSVCEYMIVHPLNNGARNPIVCSNI